MLDFIRKVIFKFTFSVQMKMVTLSDIKQKREGRSYKHLLQLVAINVGLI